VVRVGQQHDGDDALRLPRRDEERRAQGREVDAGGGGAARGREREGDRQRLGARDRDDELGGAAVLGRGHDGHRQRGQVVVDDRAGQAVVVADDDVGQPGQDDLEILGLFQRRVVQDLQGHDAGQGVTRVEGHVQGDGRVVGAADGRPVRRGQVQPHRQRAGVVQHDLDVGGLARRRLGQGERGRPARRPQARDRRDRVVVHLHLHVGDVQGRAVARIGGGGRVRDREQRVVGVVQVLLGPHADRPRDVPVRRGERHLQRIHVEGRVGWRGGQRQRDVRGRLRGQDQFVGPRQHADGSLDQVQIGLGHGDAGLVVVGDHQRHQPHAALAGVILVARGGQHRQRVALLAFLPAVVHRRDGRGLRLRPVQADRSEHEHRRLGRGLAAHRRQLHAHGVVGHHAQRDGQRARGAAFGQAQRVGGHGQDLQLGVVHAPVVVLPVAGAEHEQQRRQERRRSRRRPGRPISPVPHAFHLSTPSRRCRRRAPARTSGPRRRPASPTS